MQQQQLLEIFCSSMQQFEAAMDHLEHREAALTKQSKRMMRWVIGALLAVLVGISFQVWVFASSMGGVVKDINELTKNVGYTQGILHGMSERMAGMEQSVQSVPPLLGMVKAFNVKMPQLVMDMSAMESTMVGLEGNMARLDTSLLGINGSMSRLNFQMQLLSQHTHQFGRMMP
jgi:hypothetical protein